MPSRSFPFMVVLILGFFQASCAREAMPPEVPGMVEAPRSLSSPAASPSLPVRHGARRGSLALTIPDGEPCLARLVQNDVAFRTLPPKPGMVTPIAVTGSIGGVRYETSGHDSLVCDCRLAVALDWLGPELRSHGVRVVRHSGAYSYRTTRSGRPSLHAQGLAIDVHAVSMRHATFEVERDYVRGSSHGCSQDSPPLNRLACVLGQSGLLEEVITPDDDSDHRDHLHFAIGAR